LLTLTRHQSDGGHRRKSSHETMNTHCRRDRAIGHRCQDALLRYGDRHKEATMTDVKNVVLVHGGFVDGSGWEGVYRLLEQEGFNVSVVQNPTLSLQDDAAVTRRVLDQQD